MMWLGARKIERSIIPRQAAAPTTTHELNPSLPAYHPHTPTPPEPPPPSPSPCVCLLYHPGVARSIESDVDNLMRLIKIANILPKGMYVENAVKVTATVQLQ